MVHLASSGGKRRRSSSEVLPLPTGSLAPVKLETELEDEYAPLNKRMMMKQPSFSDQWIAGNDLFTTAPSQANPLAEPSPLGLRLKKSPSLLDLIQMRLSQGNTCTQGSKSIENSNPNPNPRERVAKGNTAATLSNDKMKAANFPASLLRIGQWEYSSKYEGGLVAKCYFAKHKLVWEVLDGGLKSKIEIQWSDIMGLNAKLPEDGPSTMTIVLARQPLFFRETNPQPRKHTLWQATPDFTDGQASTHRKHFLQFPEGALDKHFEKLIQCDARLNFLSHQPEMVVDSLYFDSPSPVLEDLKNSQDNYARREYLSPEAPSPSSVMDTRAIEGCTTSNAGSKKWEQLIMQGIRPSMSMTDLVNHIGNCISGPGITEITEEGSESHRILEDITQHLLGDSQQVMTCSDEKSLMSRVNSLCSLLQKDGTPVQLNADTGNGGCEEQKESHEEGDMIGSEEELSTCKPSMSRKDSYGDLLLNLPRIASLPKFLFEISEDGEMKV